MLTPQAFAYFKQGLFCSKTILKYLLLLKEPYPVKIF